MNNTIVGSALLLACIALGDLLSSKTSKRLPRGYSPKCKQRVPREMMECCGEARRVARCGTEPM
ncbi:hypothetical protein J6590_034686 [Homalodisca vitripennis]|nr:hypothetical protein J6590_034686 [Homalodisca vitripennis]